MLHQYDVTNNRCVYCGIPKVGVNDPHHLQECSAANGQPTADLKVSRPQIVVPNGANTPVQIEKPTGLMEAESVQPSSGGGGGETEPSEVPLEQDGGGDGPEEESEDGDADSTDETDADG